jgi:hypothetical protein
MAVGAVGVLAAACGDKRPPVNSEVSGPPGPPPNATLQFDASTKPPACNIPQPTVCDCVDLPLLTDAPNLYFVLDKSGSMAEEAKWTSVRSTVLAIVRSLGPRASFGVALFPHPVLGGCHPGAEVLSTRRGDAPAGSEGPTLKMLTSQTNVSPGGGTPTGNTLRALKPRLASLAGRTYVILATDGGPNCNGLATCDYSMCMPNMEGAPGCPLGGPNCCTPQTYGAESCLDRDNTVAAIAELAQAGIKTYVIGVPGSAPYASALDAMAQAGGAARAQAPFYYRVDSSDAAALLTVLRQIAANIVASCTIPVGQITDPSLLNVYFDETIVAKDPQDGWTIEGTTITLNGLACDRVLSGAVLDVRVIGGCPTVIK